MSALIPAIIKLIMSRAKSGGGGAGGGDAKPELSQLEKNDKYNAKRILEGDMTFGRGKEGGTKWPSQPTYQEVTGRRGK